MPKTTKTLYTIFLEKTAQKKPTTADRKRLISASFNGNNRAKNVPKITKVLNKYPYEVLSFSRQKKLVKNIKIFLSEFLDFLDLNEIKIIETYFEKETQTFLVLSEIFENYYLIQTKIHWNTGVFSKAILQLIHYNGFKESSDGTYKFNKLI